MSDNNKITLSKITHFLFSSAENPGSAPACAQPVLQSTNRDRVFKARAVFLYILKFAKRKRAQSDEKV